jgi:hypothetical protein
VELLKLLELDSSLAACTELAQELDVHAGAEGSAEQNIALHKAVMAKLAQKGGIGPGSLPNGCVSAEANSPPRSTEPKIDG